NNALTVLAKMLRVAVEWKVIDRMPATVRLLKVTHNEMEFYEESDLERLVEAAGKVDPLAHLAVLLGADAGLRMGEMIALEWSDMDFRRNLLTGARNDWRGKVGLPKGGKSRKVPMTRRLAAALSAARHLRGPRVLYRHDGRPLSVGTIRYYMAKAQQRAGLRVVDGRALGELHILRHTFCSRLAMRGATAKSIQELAGHQHLSTTQRYMHLSPAARESAIRLLDAPTEKIGDGLETGASDARQH
ncbi:MAG TPA: site-specific integrase, partial [Myxococcales bacterium]|nr:site-specific integrase [Myxococcales bacterium]